MYGLPNHVFHLNFVLLTSLCPVISVLRLTYFATSCGGFTNLLFLVYFVLISETSVAILSTAQAVLFIDLW